MSQQTNNIQWNWNSLGGHLARRNVLSRWIRSIRPRLHRTNPIISPPEVIMNADDLFPPHLRLNASNADDEEFTNNEVHSSAFEWEVYNRYETYKMARDDIRGAIVLSKRARTCNVCLDPTTCHNMSVRYLACKCTQGQCKKRVSIRSCEVKICILCI
jgi:hypothetical protein